MSEAMLIPIESSPYNAESPLSAQTLPLTPAALFYVRNHGGVPDIDAAAWRLKIRGTVDHAAEWSLDQLRALPRHEVTLTMECAGNGRTLLPSAVPGTPWNLGAISTGTFAGTSLQQVLTQAGLAPNTIELIGSGADTSIVDGAREIVFERSIPIATALQPDVLLAWELNGEPLSPDHGFPVRLVVPNWYGVASIKWLTTLTATVEPFTGFYQRDRYIYTREDGTPEGQPVRAMRVRAIISGPAEGATVPGRTTRVAGKAWSGEGDITRVEISTDDGGTWATAMLDEPFANSSYAGRTWHYAWTPRSSGEQVLVVRATDSAGNTQPLVPRVNRFGYGNNVAQRVRVMVQ